MSDPCTEYDLLVGRVMRQGAWLCSPAAQLLPPEEWETAFTHYQTDLERLRAWGDALRLQYRCENTYRGGDALAEEVRALFEDER